MMTDVKVEIRTRCWLCGELVAGGDVHNCPQPEHPASFEARGRRIGTCSK